MDLAHVTVTLSNLKSDGDSFEDEFLVDTDAIDCLAPSCVLTQAVIAVLKGVMYMS